MARLSGERDVTLAASTTVGRDPSCAMRLSDRRVSSLHARLTWTGAGWVVRDLGSTNGTFVDGVRLPPGVDRKIGQGARLAFGDPAVLWVMDDPVAPRAQAVDLGTGVIVVALDGVLTLLPGTAAEVTLLETAGRWTRLGQGDESPVVVVDRDIIDVGDARYCLELPVLTALTPQSATNDDHGFALSFRVGDDEETLSLTVVGPEGAAVVAPRTSHYLLLTLMRARIADRAAGFPELQAGWREVAELCRELSTDENRMNVEVHRLRKQLGEHGLPATVIERRPGTRLVRIGVARLVILGR